uniref:G-type lectin S-receptor-like serine/threonine-protein kinase At4g27290 n=1 Tax=Rhizophora mucronata TaxID=61149 RepID=A0A2P2IM30_RHIMU
MGISLLATQTTEALENLYHMPTYLLVVELPGLKNPSSKVPPAETMVSPSLIDRFTPMISATTGTKHLEKKKTRNIATVARPFMDVQLIDFIS